MDLRQGFLIEEPSVTIPWTACAEDVETLLAGQEIREVTGGYIVAQGMMMLGGLRHLALGFHFDKNGIWRFECFERNPERKATPAFLRHQAAMERFLGPPTWTGPQWEGYGEGPACDYVWQLNGGLVLHRLMYRFGFEEHLWIVRPGMEVPYGDPRQNPGQR